MDIEKDSNREAFEAWFESRYDANFMQFALDLDMYVDKHTQTSWEAWQAAKAQAVPKGFVLVNQKELMELAIAINAVDLATHTEGKPNEVREMWQQVALKLGALCSTGASQ
jgi:hypothetical protein